MKQHLPDLKSAPVKVEIRNPGYISPEKLAYYRSLEKEKQLWANYFCESADEIIADAKAVWGDPFKPTALIELYSKSYCGEKLIRHPKPGPGLYDAINYTHACSLLDYSEEELCFDCIQHLDEIRSQQGYRPVLDYLRDPDSCCCAGWVLQRNGCQCWAGRVRND